MLGMFSFCARAQLAFLRSVLRSIFPPSSPPPFYSLPSLFPLSSPSSAIFISLSQVLQVHLLQRLHLRLHRSQLRLSRALRLHRHLLRRSSRLRQEARRRVRADQKSGPAAQPGKLAGSLGAARQEVLVRELHGRQAGEPLREEVPGKAAEDGPGGGAGGERLVLPALHFVAM